VRNFPTSPTSGPGRTPDAHPGAGNATLNTLYWTKDRPDSFYNKMAKAAGAKEGDLIAFCHTHKPWHRLVEGVSFLNTGSVNKPKDGDWRAGYVLVEADVEIGVVEFVRVEYDLEKAVDAIHRSELPDEFADQLNAGGTPKPSEVG
jgi:hypothetical protein